MTHKIYEVNEKGRDFVVGDLHGCMGLLSEKLHEVEFDVENDRLFSVGDLVDRGPDSMGCLSLILKSWFHPVQGNHEDMMLDVVLNGQDPYFWVINGGGWYEEERVEDLKSLCEEVKRLPYSITVKTKNGDIGICHSEPPSKYWAEAENPTEEAINVMLWARDWVGRKDTPPVRGVLKTYHGHTILDEPIQKENVNFIDTGAFYTGKLTVVRIEEIE